eukprot:5100506-Pyramimonas_sp.AAC.1
MGRPSRSPNFEQTPRVWRRGDGLGRRVDPTCNHGEALLTKDDYRWLRAREAQRAEQNWKELDENHRLKRFSRGCHATAREARAASSAGHTASSSREGAEKSKSD